MTSVHRIRGYTVVLHPTKMKVIRVECAVNAGFLNETESTSGIHHLLEHILANAFKACNDNCSRYWQRRGVEMNASTDTTMMEYHAEGVLEDTADIIKYIINISTRPDIKLSTIKHEKEAIIDELLAEANDESQQLLDVFSKRFYRGGIRYQEDCHLQVANLSKLSVEDVKRVYQSEFNRNNMLYLVSGKFNAKDVLGYFDRLLPKSQAVAPVPYQCFSYKREIVFIPRKGASSTEMHIGFPTTLQINQGMYYYISPMLWMLESIMFDVLRAEHHLVYYITWEYEVNSCGVSVFGVVNVRNENVKRCFELILSILKRLAVHPYPAHYIEAAKKIEQKKYYKSRDKPEFYTNQYLSQMGTTPIIVSRKHQLERVMQMTAKDLMETHRHVFNLEYMLVVYQGKSMAGIEPALRV